MFGFGNAAKLKKIEDQVGEILAHLAKASEHQIQESAHGMRDVSSWAKNIQIDDAGLARNIADQADATRSESPFKAIGYYLVSLMYQARAVGNVDGLKIAGRIQDIIHETSLMLEEKSSRSPQGAGVQSQPAANDVIAKAIDIANLLVEFLKHIKVYENVPVSLLKPIAIGYVWGWCDAGTQKLGLPRNSSESLALCSSMFTTVYKKDNFPVSDFGVGEQMLGTAKKYLDEQNQSFFNAMIMGGSDLFEFFNSGKPEFPKSMFEHAVDIFGGYLTPYDGSKPTTEV